MTKRVYALAVAALLALPLLTGCGSSKSGSSSTATPAASTTTTGSGSDEPGPETVDVARAAMGTILVDGEGKAMYLFEHDRGTQSTCTASCATNWPPVTTDGAPQAGGGLTASMLGTTARADGSTQVTYGGHPLYYYAGDTAAGQTNGQGKDAFGGEWYVVGPNGKKVESDEGAGHDAGDSSSSGGY